MDGKHTHYFSIDNKKDSLLHFKIQRQFIFNVRLQAVADFDGTYAVRGTGKNQIAVFEGKILGSVRDDLIYRKNHVFGVALLHGRSVDV